MWPQASIPSSSSHARQLDFAANTSIDSVNPPQPPVLRTVAKTADAKAAPDTASRIVMPAATMPPIHPSVSIPPGLHAVIRVHDDPQPKGKAASSAAEEVKAAHRRRQAEQCKERLLAQANPATQAGHSPLMLAAAADDAQAASLLIETGADVNAATPSGDTALMVACRHGAAAAVKLLAKTADVNRANADGDSALTLAAAGGHTAVVQRLLVKGANANHANLKGERALALALRSGKRDLVLALLAQDAATAQATAPQASLAQNRALLNLAASLSPQGAGINSQGDGQDLNKMLVNAISQSNAALTEILLANGANPRHDYDNGRPVLMHAAWRGDVLILKMLLGRGADVNTVARNGITALAEAAARGHVAACEALLAAGANMNLSGQSTKPALSSAAETGQLEAVRLLLRHGADTELVYSNMTALMRACKMGQAEVALELIRHGAQVNAVTYNGRTTSLTCVVEGHAKMDMQLNTVRVLLDNGADINFIEAQNSWTVLQTACHNKHIGLPVVALLLERGASLQSCPAGYSPLHSAAYTGHMDILALLIERGADLRAGADGWTPLTHAATYGHLDAVQLLLSKDEQAQRSNGWATRALLIVAENGHLNVLQLLLDKGADVNHAHASRNNGTALMEAVRAGKRECVALLLKHGAQTNAVSKFGESALLAAAHKGDVEIVEMLLAKGANPHYSYDSHTVLKAAIGSHNLTLVELLLGKGVSLAGALSHAARTRNADMVKALLKRNADVNESVNQRPLSAAAVGGNLEVLDLLIAAGAHLQPANAGDSKHPGIEALLLAIQYRHVDVARRLIEKGVPVDLADKENLTPLMHAAGTRENAAMVEFLLSCGANLLSKGCQVNRTDQSGQTALDHAVSSGYRDIEAILRQHGGRSGKDAH
jgi:ankyrin repeat protein